MARRDTRTVGDDAELLAYKFLRKQGLKPVTRNFHCRLGEIDLVMLDQGCLVFVEVRYRTANRFAPARSTVDLRKQGKLLRTAAMFLSTHSNYAEHTVRFDVMAIDNDVQERVSFEWIRDAFRPIDSSL